MTGKEGSFRKQLKRMPVHGWDDQDQPVWWSTILRREPLFISRATQQPGHNVTAPQDLCSPPRTSIRASLQLLRSRTLPTAKLLCLHPKQERSAQNVPRGHKIRLCLKVSTWEVKRLSELNTQNEHFSCWQVILSSMRDGCFPAFQALPLFRGKSVKMFVLLVSYLGDHHK